MQVDTRPPNQGTGGECGGFQAEDGVEEEDLVAVMVRLFATTADRQGTLHDISRILYTLHVNTADSLTIP